MDEISGMKTHSFGTVLFGRLIMTAVEAAAKREQHLLSRSGNDLCKCPLRAERGRRAGTSEGDAGDPDDRRRARCLDARAVG